VSAWGDRLCIKVDPYDKANAESIFFDVVTELQANELLIADFAHLYYQPRRNIRAATDADAWPPIPQQYPPDFVLHRDLENAITSESPASELVHTDTNWRNGRRQAMSFAGDRKRLATGASTSYLQQETEAQF
jgi:hypothetical protein